MKRKTTITLTIAALLAMAGVLYAASLHFFSPDLDPQGQSGPIGEAASQTDLYASDYCTATGVPLRKINSIACDGTPTFLTSVPTTPGCDEMYMAIAPLVSANAGFTPRDVFITNGTLIYRFTPPSPPPILGPADVFATIPDSGCDPDHTGITFDHTGIMGFDYNMFVTCHDGTVWKVADVGGVGVVTPFAFVVLNGLGRDIEGPAVVPTTFGGIHAGKLWVADEDYPGHGAGPGALHAISSTGVVTLDVVDWDGAESVQVIPAAPCAFCSGGIQFQSITIMGSPNGIYQYFLSDLTTPVDVRGDILIPSEQGGGGTGLVTFDSINNVYVTTTFDSSLPGAIFEGATFVDCDVPSPTPTSTPTATATATSTATATATSTATATATATSTPTPTPTPPGPCQLSTTIKSDFNGTPISAGNWIWFNAVLKPSGLPPATAVTITFTNQTITSAFFTIPVPDATVTFDPNAASATTMFSGGMWQTTAPSFGMPGNTFFSGHAYQVPVNLPGGINPVTWSGTVNISQPGVTLQWQWAAAVYTNFAPDSNAIGVKPVDGDKKNPYPNSDHAGTPESFKHFVIGGARGGGGSNWTGSYSGTANVGPCR